MSCPTCGHTLEKVADHIFHCPRCGTMAVQWAGNSRSDTYVPKLVARCREFTREAAEHVTQKAIDIWNRLGIAESINAPKGSEVAHGGRPPDAVTGS